MSRLAKKPITIPQGASVAVRDGGVSVTGPKGSQNVKLPARIDVRVEGAGVHVASGGTTKQDRANTGTVWSLVRNAIEGCVNGFSKELEIEGVGFRAVLEGQTLTLHLGYAHPVRVPIPAGITVVVEKNAVTVSGVSKELVGRFAAEVRALKKPEPYKGKGIRYKGEVIRRKAGKKAATGTA